MNRIDDASRQDFYQALEDYQQKKISGTKTFESPNDQLRYRTSYAYFKTAIARLPVTDQMNLISDPRLNEKMFDLYSKAVFLADKLAASKCVQCEQPNKPVFRDNPKQYEFLLQKCGTCFVALYCSRKCQREDWPVHKLFCQPPSENV